MTTNDKQFVEEITDISKINLIESTEETTPGIRLLERLADEMEKRENVLCIYCRYFVCREEAHIINSGNEYLCAKCYDEGMRDDMHLDTQTS